MVTFRISTDIPEDRRIVLSLPADTPLGKAELVVAISTESEACAEQASIRNLFGSISSRDPRSADNQGIDADLARAYDESDE